MSYSLNKKCKECTKKDKCSDSSVLEGAIYSIHMIGNDRGHLGGGSIDLNCQNFEQKTEKEGN